MRFCPNCNFQNSESWTSCRECGSSLSLDGDSAITLPGSNFGSTNHRSVDLSHYDKILDASYRTHYFGWLIPFSVWTLWQVALELISGRSLSLLTIGAFIVTALIVIPVVALLTWFIFRQLKRLSTVRTG